MAGQHVLKQEQSYLHNNTSTANNDINSDVNGFLVHYSLLTTFITSENWQKFMVKNWKMGWLNGDRL